MNTQSRKALFVGCSFTADCGFAPDNQTKYHWPHLFCQQTNYQLVNQAIGGMSNHEIFLRTIEHTSTEHYDLVVVMWSEVSRHWVYCSKNNVDDFTILNSGTPKGFQSSVEYTNEYAKLHYSYFNNRYVCTKNWLLYCLALENFLKNKSIPYIFVKGFNNYINDFRNAEYDKGFKSINNLKTLLDFDNRPDEYILKKITEIQNLIDLQDCNHWLNLFSLAFKDMTIDTADDSLHPGPKSNLNLTTDIIKFYKGLND